MGEEHPHTGLPVLETAARGVAVVGHLRASPDHGATGAGDGSDVSTEE